MGKKNTFTTMQGKKAARAFPAQKPGMKGSTKPADRKALFPPKKKK